MAHFFALVIAPPEAQKSVHGLVQALWVLDRFSLGDSGPPSGRHLWNRWTVGGRFNGLVKGIPRPPGDPTHSLAELNLRANAALVSEIPTGIEPAYILMPDGRIFEENEDYGISSDVDHDPDCASVPEFPLARSFRELLVGYERHVAIGIDVDQ